MGRALRWPAELRANGESFAELRADRWSFALVGGASR